MSRFLGRLNEKSTGSTGTGYNPYKGTGQKRGIVDRAIRFKCSLQNTILDVLRHRGWQEVTGDGDYDIFWCDREWLKENYDHSFFPEHVKICHFRNHYELTRKKFDGEESEALEEDVGTRAGESRSSQVRFFSYDV